ncbi:MAG: carbohydrate porin [Phycisphaeraceae bacterium]|nr:carbohydrate porin [Phycisphaeraceae bacterium]
MIPAGEPDRPERDRLLGDVGGHRSNLESRGIAFEFSWTHVAQGVIRGGERRDWDLCGNADLLIEADLEALRLAPGGSLAVRLESRYGETVNDDSGAFSPVNTRGYFPLTDRENEGIPFTITELNYTLPVGETVEVTVGKMLMYEGDPVEFAGGGGKTQFLNSNFIYNASASLPAPYSTLGLEAAWTPDPAVTFSAAIFSTADSSTTTGFDHLDDGWTVWGQADTRYRMAGLPGGVNAGFLYAFQGEFVRLGGWMEPGEDGSDSPTAGETWSVFAGLWQYVHTIDQAPDEIDASDAHADLRGLGIFARVGFADRETNPAQCSLSVGLGGRGLILGRDDDTYGVGYYSTDVVKSLPMAEPGVKPAWRGVEVFYSVALTPAARVTGDVQWIDDGAVGTAAATVIGLRLNLEF